MLDRGPSLIGVGQAAAYFQVSTGRMPADANGAQMPRKQPVFTDEQIDALGAFIQSNGGGPSRSRRQPADDAERRQGRRAVPAELRLLPQLHRSRAAPCPRASTRPASTRPPTRRSTRAMLSGPENMPKFSRRPADPGREEGDHRFIQNNKATIAPGGYDLGGFGPAPEGLVAFLVGMGADRAR